MRDSIVHMQYFQIVLTGDVSHLGRQGQRIRRMFEQRVSCRFDSMKKQILLVAVEPKGDGITYKMNLMTSRGKLLPQLGGDYPGAARDRITCYADVHIIRRIWRAGLFDARPYLYPDSAR